MRDDPLWQGATRACSPWRERAEKEFQWGISSAVIHRAPNAFDELVEWPGSIAEHLHLFARLGQVRRQENVFLLRDLLAPAKKIFRRREQRVRCEAPRRASFDSAPAFARLRRDRQDRLRSRLTE